MDMWPAFMSAASPCVPQADIVHYMFHIAKYLGEAVDTVRKQEHRRLLQAGASPLTGSLKDRLVEELGRLQSLYRL